MIKLTALILVAAITCTSAVLRTPGDVDDALEVMWTNCAEFYENNDIVIDYDDARENLLDSYAAIDISNEDITTTYVAGINCLSLLSNEQRLEFMDGGAIIPEGLVGSSWRRHSGSGYTATSDQPAEFDHRDTDTVTPARSQGSCGSCWSFSGMGCLESAYLVMTGESSDQVDFSEQQLLDCTCEDRTDYTDCCGGAWMDWAWQRLHDQEDNILVSESTLPYVGQDNTCDICGMPNGMRKVQLTKDPDSSSHSYYDYDDSTITNPMAESTAAFIYQKHAVSVAIMAESPFSYYESGVFNTQCDSDSINHAVILFGYTQDVFWLQNSWGTWWGDNGNMQLSRRDGNICSTFTYLMYPYLECRNGVNSDGFCNEPEKEEFGCGEDDDDDKECTKKCKNGKVCYWKDDDKMKCRCPDGTYGKGCSETSDCSSNEKKRCSKLQTKKPDKFAEKCMKSWGAKKCPISCGFCDN